MTRKSTHPHQIPTESQLGLLSLLNEPGAVLALAQSMDKAAILVGSASGDPCNKAVVARDEAEHCAQEGWISCVSGAKPAGQVRQYRLSAAGKRALQSMRPDPEAGETAGHAASPRKSHASCRQGGPGADTPLAALARRKDKNGAPFLSRDLVRAGDRLREDFEIAQIGNTITQNWQTFLTPGTTASRGGGQIAVMGAKDRVRAALADLGPGLGDVALLCCCHLKGLEAAEKHLGRSARSGKIVLKIALERLKRHYDSLGDLGNLVG